MKVGASSEGETWGPELTPLPHPPGPISLQYASELYWISLQYGPSFSTSCFPALGDLTACCLLFCFWAGGPSFRRWVCSPEIEKGVKPVLLWVSIARPSLPRPNLVLQVRDSTSRPAPPGQKRGPGGPYSTREPSHLSPWRLRW